MDKWRATVEDEEEGYARAVAAQSKEIRRLEKEGMKLHKQRRRDVGKFRSHLVELTTKLDGLTTLHGEHARTLLRESQETSVRIVDASCSLVRAEMEIFEGLARKGWTGGGLEDVLEKGVDLFAAEEPVGCGAMVGSVYGKSGGIGAGGNDGDPGGGGVGSGEGSKLFSILPPKSILADSGSDTIRIGRHNRTDSLLEETDRYQSLAGAVSPPAGMVPGQGMVRDHDTESVFSEFNRSRGIRPFSPQPQPIRLNPDDLLGGPEGHDDSVSPSDETATLLSKQQQQRRSSESTTDQDDSREGCAVYDDDEEAHPWRNEQGLAQRKPRHSMGSSKQGLGMAGRLHDDVDGGEEDVGDDTVVSLTLHSPQEQQQIMEGSVQHGGGTREGRRSWTNVGKDDHDETGEGGGVKP